MAKVKQTTVAKKVLKNFLFSSAQQIAEEIKVDSKSICPVRTGELKRSIQIDDKKTSIFIGSPLDYAIFVEMGTRFQTAQSFLRKAFYNVIRKKL